MPASNDNSDHAAPDPGGPHATPLRVPRLIGNIRGPGAGGPTLVCTAGLHGNEPSGIHGLRRVFAALERDATGLLGRLIGFSGNRSALRDNVRHHALDMNRAWLPEILERIRAMDRADLRDEEIEIRELDEALAEVVGETDCLLDLHSTSGPGKPFVTMDDTLRNRYFARSLPVPRVLGLEEELAGTLTGYIITKYPIPAVGFESGRHDDESSIDNAAAAVWIALESSGVLAWDSRPEPAESRALLSKSNGGPGVVVEVRHRHEVHPGSDFQMEPGFQSFQQVQRGQRLALDKTGPVHSPEAALMLMPRYQGLGSDGFFLVRPVHPMWLALSAWMRRLQAVRWVHVLPGVRRHPDRPGSFLINRERARWLALQIFHLLGFRREPATGTELVMTPRDGSRALTWS